MAEYTEWPPPPINPTNEWVPCQCGDPHCVTNAADAYANECFDIEDDRRKEAGASK